MVGTSNIFYFLQSFGSKRRSAAYCRHRHINMAPFIQTDICAFRQFVFSHPLYKPGYWSKPDSCSAAAPSFHLLTDSHLGHRAGTDREWQPTHLVAAATTHAFMGKPTWNVRPWNNYPGNLFCWRNAG